MNLRDFATVVGPWRLPLFLSEDKWLLYFRECSKYLTVQLIIGIFVDHSAMVLLKSRIFGGILLRILCRGASLKTPRSITYLTPINILRHDIVNGLRSLLMIINQDLSIISQSIKEGEVMMDINCLVMATIEILRLASFQSLLSSSHPAEYIRRPRPLPWQSGLFEDSLKAAGLSSLDSGTKIYISNLDFGVSNEDIRELFSEFGELIRYAIHFDKNALPSGTAEVVFARPTDAFQAFKRYNNVQLDGRSMKMEIIGANAPISPRVNVGGANGKKRAVVVGRGLGGRSTGDFAATNRYSVQRSQGGPSNFRGGRGGGGRGGSRRGRGGARRANRSVKKSADELDKELESYHADAMQS